MSPAPSFNPFGWITLLTLIAFLAWPANAPARLDGLPWSQVSETAAIMGLVPLLVLLGRGFIGQRRACLALLILLLLKLPLALWAPACGWEARTYATPQDLQRGSWERTYASLWRPHLSEVLDRPWPRSIDFPIEWMNRGPVPLAEGFWLGLELQGWVRPPAGAGLVLVAKGVADARLIARDDQGRERPLAVVDDYEQAAALEPGALLDGAARVEGSLIFDQSGDWSLEPVLVRSGGRVESATDQASLWRGPEAGGASDAVLGRWRTWAGVLDLGLAGWLAAWAFWTLLDLRRRGLLDLTMVLWALVPLLGPLVLEGYFPPLPHLLSLGLPVGLTCLGLALSARLMPRPWAGRGSRLGTVVLAVLAPGVLTWFLRYYTPYMAAMDFFTPGQDWLTYQNLARRIFLSGDWLNAAEGVWHMQPLYRYVVGACHALFGQSAAAQHMLDVWSALGATALTASLAAALGLGPAPSLLAAALFAIPEFTGMFRYHIGAGLQEHLAMLLMLAAAWGVTRWCGLGWRGALGAGLLAVAGYWLRQDQLGLLAALGVLGLEQDSGGLIHTWKSWLAALWRRRVWLALYLGLLALGVLAVAGRNWWLGGLFTLTSPENLEFLTKNKAMGLWWNFRVVLLANEGPAHWPAWVLVPGTLLGLLALVLRWGPLGRYPLSLGVCLLGLLAPFLWVMPSAYPPRFSLRLLPLAAISLALAAAHLLPSAWREPPSPPGP